MVSVRVSETYDLSTQVGKLGLVGIHTPTGTLIDRMWPGLVLQHKKFRFVSCDVAMACASVLPADPLQVGVEAGQIAPEDMFNPILYKAVSNDSMSSIQGYLQGLIANKNVATVEKGSIGYLNDPEMTFTGGSGGTEDIDQVAVYYSLLADTSGWKKAMPQAGLVMRGLYPLVYQMVSMYGQNSFPQTPGNSNVVVPSTGDANVQTIIPNTLRGPSIRMPSVDTTAYVAQGGLDGNIVPAGVANIESNTGLVQPAYVALIVIPPAKLNRLYFRLKVTWTIEFTGLRSMSDVGKWYTLQEIGRDSYGTDYAAQSASMDVKTSMVDVTSADVSKIMEGS